GGPNAPPRAPVREVATEGGMGPVETTMAYGHSEGSGRAPGTLIARGKTYEIDALCHRDHSWGPREWKGFTGHRWVVGSLGEELSFKIGRASCRERGEIARRGV